MSEWKILSDLVDRKIGYGIVQPGNSGGTVPVIKVNNIIAGLNSINDLETTTEDIASKYERTKLQGGELIISLVGTVGVTAIVPKDFAGCNLVRATGMIDIKDEILAKYVKYYLETRNAKEFLYGRLNTTVQPTLNIKTLGNLPIPILDKKRMESIVAILSSLDDKIAVNRRICENLEAQAQALFKHWFIDFAPFKDGKFVESELGMIPEGWRVGKLEEVCSFISRGLSPKYELGTNEMVLGQTCVRNNIVTLDNAREHNPKANTDKRVQKWDVLLNSTGIGSLGRVGVVYFDNNNVCFDSHLTVVRSKKELFCYYLGRNLLSRQKEIENMAVGSTGQTELPKKDVLVMPILIPSDHSLTVFNELIDNIGNEMYSLVQENLRLSHLRDTLLPKLMSGEIKL